MSRQRPDLVQPAILPPGCRIRVDTNGGIDAIVLLGQANHLGKIRRINRGDDDAANAGCPGPRHHLVPVFVEAVKIQMTMGIYQHRKSSITDATPGTIQAAPLTRRQRRHSFAGSDAGTLRDVMPANSGIQGLRRGANIQPEWCSQQITGTAGNGT